ncbi:MAG: UDP-glucose 6-dehydrogenase, partial [Pseudomonadota bacterium]|nr:UDP-glucose 6-dehydrogenase [Pseudomonadota bacterium]
AHEIGYKAELLTAVENINQRQKQVLFNKIIAHYNSDIKGMTFALWCLAFKPKTDDMRKAPSRVLLESLINAGAYVRAYDPEALGGARKIYTHLAGLTLFDSQDLTLDGSNALCIVTEWKNFWSPDFSLLKQKLADAAIFDGRNLYNPNEVKRHGLNYFSIGRAIAEA